jgi:hypothetical protein
MKKIYLILIIISHNLFSSEYTINLTQQELRMSVAKTLKFLNMLKEGQSEKFRNWARKPYEKTDFLVFATLHDLTTIPLENVDSFIAQLELELNALVSTKN